ncbi:MarR family winged helix-turn-helix transcriptional regulator [Methanobrevibacter sp.]|uniref:MarR family winged helix-turn-helix transcriptional regulator n=1 Tax=Methanobrevibacter sp. TaxID=66852 RepID=UPI00388ED2FF
MTIEDFKNIDATLIPPGKMITMAARGINIYVNHNLEKFGINATQLYLLFEISNENPINQEKIASRCNINKGAVARSVKKLEDKGLVERQIDENNRRQNKVFLTEKGNETLNETIKLFDTWEREVINKNQIIEKELLQKVLKEIVINTMELNARESKK